MIAAADASLDGATFALVLGTAATLFALGAVGCLLRRNPMALLMSIELMLNAANLVLVLAARVRGCVDAHAAALIVLVLAAAEAVIGLALALAPGQSGELYDQDFVPHRIGVTRSLPRGDSPKSGEESARGHLTCTLHGGKRHECVNCAGASCAPFSPSL